MKMNPCKLFLYVFFFVCLMSCSFFNYSNTYSFNDVLKYYGFETIEQQQALYDLLRLSSVVYQAPLQQESFSIKNSNNILVKDIVTLIDETQKNFFMRAGNKERWEVKPTNWMEEHKEQVFLNMQTLGFVDDVLPIRKKFDAMCIFGGLQKRMASRIDYGNRLIEGGLNIKAVILLAGERYVTGGVDADGSVDELIGVASECQKDNWQQLTETDLIKYVYYKSDLFGKKYLDYIIDTPKRDLPRPTTATTIIELIEWLKNHPEIKSILFISSQPHVKSQYAMVDSIFKSQGVAIDYEVVGVEVLDKTIIQNMVGGLGSYVWTVSPMVLKAMKIESNDHDIKESFKKLYAHQPVLYQALAPCFRVFDEEFKRDEEEKGTTQISSPTALV